MNKSNDCIFCNATPAVLRNDLAFAIPDKYPASRGHMLIIPFRHVENYFQTTVEERQAILHLLDEAKALVDRQYAPKGYNIGINVGSAAGQTVWHVHAHLIPRYEGDVENPRGGVRAVIPGRQSY
jgi:diadenosine tetraphosphate (Ap4A) HIT family hydrolase